MKGAALFTMILVMTGLMTLLGAAIFATNVITARALREALDRQLGRSRITAKLMEGAFHLTERATQTGSPLTITDLGTFTNPTIQDEGGKLPIPQMSFALHRALEFLPVGATPLQLSLRYAEMCGDIPPLPWQMTNGGLNTGGAPVFETVEDLATILSPSAAGVRSIREYFTVFPTGGVNANTARLYLFKGLVEWKKQSAKSVAVSSSGLTLTSPVAATGTAGRTWARGQSVLDGQLNAMRLTLSYRIGELTQPLGEFELNPFARYNPWQPDGIPHDTYLAANPLPDPREAGIVNGTLLLQGAGLFRSTSEYYTLTATDESGLKMTSTLRLQPDAPPLIVKCTELSDE